MSYYLIDCVKRNKVNPATFHIPNKEERQNLQIGDYAKLIFNDKERMWVQITKKVSSEKYQGSLANDPYDKDKDIDLKFGDEIQFGIKHICDIMKQRVVENESISSN